MSDWFRESLRERIFERELERRNAAGVPSLLARAFQVYRGNWDAVCLALALDLTRLSVGQPVPQLLEFSGLHRHAPERLEADMYLAQAPEVFELLLRGTTLERFLRALETFAERTKPHSFEREAVGNLSCAVFDIACGRKPDLDLGSAFLRFVQRNANVVFAAFDGQLPIGRGVYGGDSPRDRPDAGQ